MYSHLCSGSLGLLFFLHMTIIATHRVVRIVSKTRDSAAPTSSATLLSVVGSCGGGAGVIVWSDPDDNY